MAPASRGARRPFSKRLETPLRAQRWSGLCLDVVPVTSAGSNCSFVAGEPMLEVVEDRKLVACHDVVVRLGLNLAPDVCDRLVKNLANGGVRCTGGALTGNLERLRDVRHDRLRRRSQLEGHGRGVAGNAGNEGSRVGQTVRHADVGGEVVRSRLGRRGGVGVVERRIVRLRGVDMRLVSFRRGDRQHSLSLGGRRGDVFIICVQPWVELPAG